MGFNCRLKKRMRTADCRGGLWKFSKLGPKLFALFTICQLSPEYLNTLYLRVELIMMGESRDESDQNNFYDY